MCLLVDRSGSMGGRPLATNAVAAAAVAFRAPDDFSVVSFAKDSVVVKSQDGTTPVEAIVDGVLALRATARPTSPARSGRRRPAAGPLERRAQDRRAAVGLPGDRARRRRVVAAAALDELAIVAPDGDDEAAAALADAVGAMLTTVTGPSAAAEALTRVLN